MKQFTAKIDGATSKGVNVHIVRHAVSAIAKLITRSRCSRRLGQDAVIDIFLGFSTASLCVFRKTRRKSGQA